MGRAAKNLIYSGKVKKKGGTKVYNMQGKVVKTAPLMRGTQRRMTRSSRMAKEMGLYKKKG